MDYREKVEEAFRAKESPENNPFYPAVPLSVLCEVKVPKPQHGDTWGKWTYDAERLVLKHPCYEIDLERCGTPEALLDWIFQLVNKVFMSTEDCGQMLFALQDILKPQENLCSRCM